VAHTKPIAGVSVVATDLTARSESKNRVFRPYPIKL